MVARELVRKISSHLKDRNNLFATDGLGDAASPAVLLLVSRSVDLSTALAHPWTYQVSSHKPRFKNLCVAPLPRPFAPTC
jgi:hypothetical protein